MEKLYFISTDSSSFPNNAKIKINYKIYKNRENCFSLFQEKWTHNTLQG